MQAQTLHLERFPLSLLFASPPRWALCSSRGQSLGWSLCLQYSSGNLLNTQKTRRSEGIKVVVQGLSLNR